MSENPIDVIQSEDVCCLTSSLDADVSSASHEQSTRTVAMSTRFRRTKSSSLTVSSRVTSDLCVELTVDRNLRTDVKALFRAEYICNVGCEQL